ncbi:MAG: GNAT family N-acetyltransferase [Hyphomonadaceae bacterium]|nr:GNAT family N-acetyltransferase [Hyphomonadaceae bacterium]
MSFTVRDLMPGDRPAWEHLWGGYLDFYQAPMDAVVIEVTWARLLAPTEPMAAMVAQDDETGELLGFVHCVFHRGTWAIGDLCYLEDLFVASVARKRGVGRALIEAVYGLADARGCDRVYWLTQESNAPARALYDRIARRSGFIQYRRA